MQPGTWTKPFSHPPSKLSLPVPCSNTPLYRPFSPSACSPKPAVFLGPHPPPAESRPAFSAACFWQCFLTSPSVQFSSVAQSCPTLCNPMDCSTSGFPVHHQLPEPTQTLPERLEQGWGGLKAGELGMVRVGAPRLSPAPQGNFRLGSGPVVRPQLFETNLFFHYAFELLVCVYVPSQNSNKIN